MVCLGKVVLRLNRILRENPYNPYHQWSIVLKVNRPRMTRIGRILTDGITRLAGVVCTRMPSINRERLAFPSKRRA